MRHATLRGVSCSDFRDSAGVALGSSKRLHLAIPTWRCNELLSTWFSMVDGRAGVAAWRTMSWRMLGCNAGCGSAQHGGAARCRGQQLRAAASLSSSVWLTAAAFAIVSSDMTAHASCFHEGLLRIALWSPDACCWSLSSCVPAEGGYIRWYAMSLAACCVICAKKLRGGQPNPVWAWAWVTGPSVRPSVSMSVRPSRCPSIRPTVRSPHGDGDGHGHGHGHGRLSAKW